MGSGGGLHDEITGIISDLNDISSIQLAGDIME